MRRRVDRADPEAIHDFRVALRRLRSTLRTFRPELSGRVRGRTRRGLRRLADVSGASRDVQVQREWLQSRSPSLPRGQKLAARWLLKQLEHQQREADLRLGRQVRRRFARAYTDLDRVFSWLGTVEPLSDPEALPTRSLLPGKLAQHAAELGRCLALVHDVHCAAEAHAARIAAKRLRYLVEPFADELTGGEAVVARLKSLQGELGDLHDRYRSAELVRDGLLESARARAALVARDLLPGLSHEHSHDQAAARAHPGLLGLARLIRSESEELFERFAEEWRGPGAREFLASIEGLVPEPPRGLTLMVGAEPPAAEPRDAVQEG